MAALSTSIGRLPENRWLSIRDWTQTLSPAPEPETQPKGGESEGGRRVGHALDGVRGRRDGWLRPPRPQRREGCPSSFLPPAPLPMDGCSSRLPPCPPTAVVGSNKCARAGCDGVRVRGVDRDGRQVLLLPRHPRQGGRRHCEPLTPEIVLIVSSLSPRSSTL